MVHRRLLGLAGDLRGPLLAGVAVGWAVLALRVAQAGLIGVVLGRIFDGGSPGDSTVLIAAIALVVLLRGGLVWARELVARAAGATIKERLRDRLYGRLLEIGPSYLATSRTGATQATVVDGVEALEAYYARYLPQLVVCLTGPVALVAWIASRDVWVGLVVLLGVVTIPTVPRLWDRVLAERGQAHWAAYRALGADYLDSMQGMATLKAMNAVDGRRRALADRSEHLYRSTMRQMAVSLVDSGLATLGMQLGVALALGVGALRVASGDLDASLLLVLLVLCAECFRPFSELSAAWHQGFLGVSAARGIEELLDAPTPAADRPGARAYPESAPTLDLEGVTYRHPGRPVPAVDDLTFSVAAGETVALVGPSGAGKSTVVDLLLRVVRADSGRVLVGGHDVDGLQAATLRRQIAVVSQDTFLFRGTVADNLRLARPEATDAQLERAARAAEVHDLVAGLPDRYETLVGERGLTLSGGQRQRIAIARAILQDAPILVLDEATSAVDAASEAAIASSLRRLTAERTTLTIAHRLNTVRGADRILVLEAGRLVEEGTHDALVVAAGRYAGLVAVQERTGT